MLRFLSEMPYLAVMDFDETHTRILECARGKILEALHEVSAIYVFGSFGTAYETTYSDLDLAVLSTETLDPVDLWHLSQEIAMEIGRDVEIIDMQKASTVFRFQVITTGLRIYCGDIKYCDALETSYLSMYLKLNEERADILGDKRDGSKK